VIVLLALWWIATERAWLPPLFLPSPEAIIRRFLEATKGDVGGTTIAGHFGWSIFRVFSAFALAVLTAVPIGIAMGVSRYMRGIFDPPIEFYRPLPPLSYLPLVVIWFGIDEASKIILIYLACFAPLALSARAGVRSVSLEQIHAAYSMGASRNQVVRYVVMPAAMPEILTGMRIAIGFGWTTLVAAEMVAANAGLGQMVLNASNFLRTDIVVMGIIVIGVVAYAFDLLMRFIEHAVVPWKGRM
jgi:taurine transport system permease protein